MKMRLLKILGVLLLLILGVLIAVPFFLEAKIGDLIRNNANANMNATLDFSEANLSLIRSFPNAEVQMENVSLVNKAPFEGDTLFAARTVALEMGLMQLLKSGDTPIAVTRLSLDGARLQIVSNENGVANYDIAKEDTANAGQGPSSGTAEGFEFSLERYEITNAHISYDDLAGNMHLELTDMQHSGTGDLSMATSELDTETKALVSFEMDSVNYLNKNKVALDAVIGIDLEQGKYTFLQNEALINQLPLVFDGFVQLTETGQEVDVTFKTPSSDFKNFLAVIPEAYAKNLDQVTTTGNFMVNGFFRGTVDEQHIPKFNINISSENASFKYPELPKAVSQVFMDVLIGNDTGLAESTYVNINKLSFAIDADRFSLTSKITELLGNTKVSADLKGNMNLANIARAYPVPKDMQLEGMLKADVSTAFDMAAIEAEAYDRTRTSGTLALNDFAYRSQDFAQPIALKTTRVSFNPTTVTLQELQGTTGQTDFNVKGTIDNFLGYLFNDEKVRGNFTLASNTFALNDFMVANGEPTDTGDADAPGAATADEIKIPAFLDAEFNATANTVIYDNIALKDVKGQLKIQDETARLTNMTSSLFNGRVAFAGEVSTKAKVPTFAMALDMKELQIAETFKALELFNVLAPVAQVLQGTLNSELALSGKLTKDFTPELSSLSGDVLAQLLTKDIAPENAPVLSALDNKLGFLDLKELDLKDLTTKLSFKDGVVAVKPFTINYKDIAIKVAGGHTFDQKLDYTATIDVPAKYLGKEVGQLIAQMKDGSLADLTIPVTASIGGLYSSPEVSTDLASGVKTLTTQLVEIQKQRLMDKGTAKAKDLLGDLFNKGGGTAQTDSTGSASPLKKEVQGVLGGLLGNDPKTDTVAKRDSVPAEREAVKKAAKNILGGLLGRKRDTAKAQKDTVN
ncbi:AsmA-like C-terminal region-containing protein [Maribacter sp. 2307ULW6-5]|uniref:AsmA family protein n=1 Tax=Maribacter sp. 2307ULW6-5 TaxID=3386275 RepID=UPI0039BCFDC5